jgi:hypothetical protein
MQLATGIPENNIAGIKKYAACDRHLENIVGRIKKMPLATGI